MSENKDDQQKKTGENQQVVDVSRRQFIKTAGMTTGGIVGGVVLGSLISKPYKREKSEPVSRDSHSHHHGSGNTMFTEAMQFLREKRTLIRWLPHQKSFSQRMKTGRGQLAWAQLTILINNWPHHGGKMQMTTGSGHFVQGNLL